MAEYIVDSTGNNNAEIIGDFTTSAVDETVTFNSGTNGEATPLKQLETTRQWLIIEVRAVGGVDGVIGKHVYSENVATIQARVEVIRQAMITLHTTFTILATHHKTNNICDVYRGDGTTTVALDTADTNITFTAPATWVIDDLTPFAPDSPAGYTNVIVDSGFATPSDWIGTTAEVFIGGNKLNADTTGYVSAVQPKTSNLTEALVEGGTYRLEITRLTNSHTGRFYLGGTSGTFTYGTGTYYEDIVCPAGATTVGYQILLDTIATYDDFTCTRIS